MDRLRGRTVAIVLLAWALPLTAAERRGVSQPPDPERPKPVTVRTAEVGYKRLPLGLAPALAVHIEVARIAWDGRVISDPFRTVHAYDPEIAEHLFASMVARQGVRKSQPIPESGSTLSAASLCDIGWALSFVSGDHRAGIQYYRASVSAAGKELEHLSVDRASIQETLYTMRTKFYGIEDWDGLERLCTTALRAQANSDEVAFWWRLFHALSLAHRPSNDARREALALVEKLSQDYRDGALSAQAKTELNWVHGSLLYQTGDYEGSIAPLTAAADADGFNHRLAAAIIRCYAIARVRERSAAITAFKEYLSKDSAVVSQRRRVAVELQRLLDER